MENAWHQHPQNSKVMVFGKLLETSNLLEGGEDGDFYSCSNGMWERLPDSFTGAMVPVPEKRNVVFIRPAKFLPEYVDVVVEVSSFETWE